jgi:hypothetical protein
MMKPTKPDLFAPLPTLDWSAAKPPFEWPQPPFLRRGVMAPLPDGPAPCQVETSNGVVVEGELIEFDPEARQLQFRVAAAGAPFALPFAQVRRLTLTQPWSLARRAPDAPVERVSAAAQERDYRIDLPGGDHLAGRTMGHRQAAEGLYLFAPGESGEAVRRVFVPADSSAQAVFGKSAEELAMERWVATPEALLRAIERQRHSRIMSVGDAVIELGFVTRGVVDQMLSRQGPDRDRPLGEMLVDAGYLEREDLRTALAHKMGYPVVDLTRFPTDPQAASLLSERSMRELRALPLMKRGRRLFVAVDDLARIPPLKALRGLAGLEIVPALAPRGRLALALSTLDQERDLWANNVPFADTVL